MADKKEKKIQYLTPAGEAIWPWINKYDERDINGKPQKPAYKLSNRYAKTNPAWIALNEKLDALVEESYVKAVEEHGKKPGKRDPKTKECLIQRAYPYYDELDEDGEETGFVILKLKQNAFMPIKKGEKKLKLIHINKFDARMTPLKNSLEVVWDEDAQEVRGTKGTVVVYGGSVVKASFTTRPYFVDSSNKAGISLDFSGVQILQLVTSSGRSASSYGFGAEEGYDGQDEDEAVEETTAASTGSNASNPTDF